MHVLDLFTIVLVGLLVGNEFAISAFVNPAIRKHHDRAQATELASTVGKAMPGWYALCLLLLTAEAILRRHMQVAGFTMAAALLWLIIIFTVTLLVPLNQRLAKAPVSDAGFDWLPVHQRWDTLHRIRILLLTVAFALFAWSALAR